MTRHIHILKILQTKSDVCVANSIKTMHMHACLNKYWYLFW